MLKFINKYDVIDVIQVSCSSFSSIFIVDLEQVFSRGRQVYVSHLFLVFVLLGFSR